MKRASALKEHARVRLWIISSGTLSPGNVERVGMLRDPLKMTLRKISVGTLANVLEICF